MCCLPVLNLKSRWRQDHSVSEPCRGKFFLAALLPSGDLLAILSVPWLAALALQSLPPFHIELSPHVSASLLINTSVLLYYSSPKWPHLTWLQLQKSYFKIRSLSCVPVVRTSTYLFRGHNSTHNRGHMILDLVPLVNRSDTMTAFKF